MVLLAAAVCTKSGKALVSRQFIEMERARIEGLLSAFPGLMSSDNSKGKILLKEVHNYLSANPLQQILL